MNLLFDIGNSSIRVRCLEGMLSQTVYLPHQQLPEILARLRNNLISVVVVSNVASPAISEIIESNFDSADVHHLRAEYKCCGVENGYLKAEALGVDRWLAVIEAYHLSSGPCLIFDAGTAITMDLVDACGVHHGGYILPGIGMMGGALGVGTNNVKCIPDGSVSLELGRSTQQAVSNGLYKLVIAWMNKEIVTFHDLYASGSVYLTGGGGEILWPYLRADVKYSRDLVLDGIHRVSVEKGWINAHAN